MGYYNPMLAYGLERFVDEAAAAGADGFIVPDLPPEEADDLDRLCRERGLGLIYFLAPTSTDDRVKLVADKAQGFIYLVSIAGVTGARTQLAGGLSDFVGRIRQSDRDADRDRVWGIHAGTGRRGEPHRRWRDRRIGAGADRRSGGGQAASRRAVHPRIESTHALNPGLQGVGHDSQSIAYRVLCRPGIDTAACGMLRCEPCNRVWSGLLLLLLRDGETPAAVSAWQALDTTSRNPKSARHRPRAFSLSGGGHDTRRARRDDGGSEYARSDFGGNARVVVLDDRSERHCSPTMWLRRSSPPRSI